MSSEGKFTKGPWSMWSSCSFRRISSAHGGDGDVLCAVVQRSDGHPDLHFGNGGFEGPDAKLILAAPEMFEALQLIAHGFKCGAIKSKLMLVNLDDEAEDAMPTSPAEVVRKAIARALGQ